MQISNEDAVLDRLWRERFDQPMPLRGASTVVRVILVQHGVDERQITARLRAARRTGE